MMPPQREDFYLRLRVFCEDRIKDRIHLPAFLRRPKPELPWTAKGKCYMKKRKKRFDIALTGIGIGGFEQVTLATLEAFKNARIIFHLTSHHSKLKKLCSNVVNLEKKYWTGEEDVEVYSRLADLLLSEARKGPGVVAVGDGHPAYYDDVTWDVYRRGKKAGLDVRILPAISCLDSMAANCDLEINANGIQILDAPSMVDYDQKINPYLDALIMQIGWFGTSSLVNMLSSRKGVLVPVVNHLTKFYPSDHRVRLMRAPYDRTESPTVITTKLAALDSHHRKIVTSMCLFIPALETE
jgi:uncharacterized protein YabN with tetrapyrrole methylase and pyrophosphatase domain